MTRAFAEKDNCEVPDTEAIDFTSFTFDSCDAPGESSYPTLIVQTPIFDNPIPFQPRHAAFQGGGGGSLISLSFTIEGCHTEFITTESWFTTDSQGRSVQKIKTNFAPCAWAKLGYLRFGEITGVQAAAGPPASHMYKAEGECISIGQFMVPSNAFQRPELVKVDAAQVGDPCIIGRRQTCDGSITNYLFVFERIQFEEECSDQGSI